MASSTAFSILPLFHKTENTVLVTVPDTFTGFGTRYVEGLISADLTDTSLIQVIGPETGKVRLMISRHSEVTDKDLAILYYPGSDRYKPFILDYSIVAAEWSRYTKSVADYREYTTGSREPIKITTSTTGSDPLVARKRYGAIAIKSGDVAQTDRLSKMPGYVVFQSFGPGISFVCSEEKYVVFYNQIAAELLQAKQRDPNAILDGCCGKLKYKSISGWMFKVTKNNVSLRVNLKPLNEILSLV